MLVSIIIPTLKSAHIITETLDSVIAQTYVNWECIIVDDGSTDDTVDVIKEYIKKDYRFQYHHRPKERLKGGNAARNYGFEVCNGDYINWLDSDDIISSCFIQKKVSAFSSSTQAVLHKNRYANYKLTRFRESKFTFTSTQNLFYHYAMEEIEIQTCGFMWRHNFLKKMQLFDETIERYQDNEFHLRMLAIKPEIKVINKELAIIRGGDGDSSQISSKKTLTKKKLYDVFYCRYQIFLFLNTVENEYYIPLLKQSYKKTLWAFYDALLFEKNFFKRLQDICIYYNKIKIVYLNNDIQLIYKIKSHLFLFYILLFGNFLDKKNDNTSPDQSQSKLSNS